MKEERTKFSYVDNRDVTHITTTNLRNGDEVKLRLSNHIIKIKEIFTLNSTVVDPYIGGLHFSGTIIKDGDYFSKREGEFCKSIPFTSIEGKVVIEDKIFSHEY